MVLHLQPAKAPDLYKTIGIPLHLTMEKDIHFNQLHAVAGRTIQAGGRTWLFFGGTAYLGLQQDQRLMQLYLQGMQQYGINNGTSRNNNVQLDIYPAAEQAAAKRFGAGAALVLSSGYLAAQMAVKHIGSKGTVLYAPATHPALWLQENPGITGRFRDWANSTIPFINASREKEFVIISNTLNNLLPERYDLSGFRDILPGKKLHFILDDSHGIGITDKPADLRAWVPEHEGFTVTVVASLAKGLGTDAGIILSDEGTIRELQLSPVYAGASPPAPAAMYAFIHGEGICEEQRQLLKENMEHFQQNCKVDCQYIPGLPVYHFPGGGLYEKLKKQGIIISSFPYPLPADPLLNRVVLSSLHTRQDIDTLLSAIHSPDL